MHDKTNIIYMYIVTLLNDLSRSVRFASSSLPLAPLRLCFWCAVLSCCSGLAAIWFWLARSGGLGLCASACLSPLPLVRAVCVESKYSSAEHRTRMLVLINTESSAFFLELCGLQGCIRRKGSSFLCAPAPVVALSTR